MKHYLTFLFPVLAFLMFSPVLAEQVNDFDVACQIFTEAKNTTFNREQRSAYVEDNLKDRVSDKYVLDTYYLVFHLEPAERYKVFKASAEEHLKSSWDCAAAKSLLQ